MKRDRVYLEHILETIGRVETYIQGDKQQFLADSLVQDGVLRNLQTMAESITRISDSLKQAHPEIDWRAISGFRNIIVHDYLGVDLHLVWDVIENRLPDLKERVRQIFREDTDGGYPQEKPQA